MPDLHTKRIVVEEKQSLKSDNVARITNRNIILNFEIQNWWIAHSHLYMLGWFGSRSKYSPVHNMYIVMKRSVSHIKGLHLI